MLLSHKRGRTRAIAFAGGLAAVALFIPAGSQAAGPVSQPDLWTGSILEVLYAPVGARGGPVSIDVIGQDLARARTVRAALREARYEDGKGVRVTVQQVRSFLARKRSPMAPFADSIIVAANRYKVDPRVVVAIAGVESTFGKHQKGFNAWGWNGGKTRWRSWEESIDSYTRQISQKYPDHRNISRIASRYNPNTPEAWSRKVKGWMTSLDQVGA